jgi:hypothetical protein
LEKLSKPEARYRYKEAQRLKKLRPLAQQQSRKSVIDLSFADSFLQNQGFATGDEFNKERLEEGGADSSDYSTVFLPWGPRWTAEKARKLMYTKVSTFVEVFSQQN